jgi:hypothetical protein
MSIADEIQFAMGCVKDAGGQNIGVTYLESGPLIWWTDGKTHSTLAMKASKITSVFSVSDHIAQSRAQFGASRTGSEESEAANASTKAES